MLVDSVQVYLLDLDLRLWSRFLTVFLTVIFHFSSVPLHTVILFYALIPNMVWSIHNDIMPCDGFNVVMDACSRNDL